MPEGFEKIKEGPAFEHRDITPEKRPKISPIINERVQARFFFDLMAETLRNYGDLKKERPEAGKFPLNNMEFFFKKSWDNFAEPVLEYEEMLAEIMTKKWESKGAKSRALNELNERRKRSLAGIQLLVPDFLFNDDKKQKKIFAQLYEGYASFIEHNKDKLDRLADLADEIGKDFNTYLSIFLRTKNDEEIRRLVERRHLKKKLKKGELPPKDVASWDTP